MAAGIRPESLRDLDSSWDGESEREWTCREGGECGEKEQGKGGEEGDGENGEVKGKGTAWSENQIHRGYGSVVIHVTTPFRLCDSTVSQL